MLRGNNGLLFKKGLLAMKWVGGLLAIAVIMGWVATASIPAATVSIDPASLKFLPPQTEGIAFVDVAALRNAALVADVLKTGSLEVEKGMANFAYATGLNPQQDVDRITVGKLGTNEILMIVQGNIDKFKAQQYFREKGKDEEIYLGQTIFPDGDGGFVFLDGVVLMGQINAVKKGIDQMSLPGSAPLRSDLTAAIQTIEAGNQVWAVGDFSLADLPPGVSDRTPVADLLKSLQRATYQMRVDTDIHARATGTFSDENSARNISDLARGALAVAKMQVAKQQPDMVHLLDGIQVSNSGTMLTVRVDESGDLLKKLQKTGSNRGN
jgi:hypothetical protein